MQKLEDEIMQLILEHGDYTYLQGLCEDGDEYMEREVFIESLLGKIRGKIHDLVLQVDHSNLVVETAKEKIEELSKAEVPDGFGSAEHWKEKAQYWAGVAHELRGQALRGEPVDGIIQPSPQAQPADAQDAKRYRWLRNGNAYVPEEEYVRGGEELDFLCDKMIGLGK